MRVKFTPSFIKILRLLWLVFFAVSLTKSAVFVRCPCGASKKRGAPIKRCILLGATNIKLVKSRNKISKDKVDSNDGKDNRLSKDDDITDD